MLRAALALALLPACAALRKTDVQQVPPVPKQRAFGPERRSCRITPGVCNKTSCRPERQATKVIGGEVVDSGDVFPFLAWVGDDDGTGLRQFCGGSLIHPRVVLTAGHCLYNSDYLNANIYVRFRLADFAVMPGIARKVVGWKRHEDYSPYTLYEDLSLLLLNESVPEDVAKPLRISDGTSDFDQHGDKTVIGWGSTNEECTVYDTLLRRSKVPMGDYGDRCSTQGSKVLTPSDQFDVHRQVCAGDYFGAMHYPGCGDSGGPLLAGTDGDFTQVGMVSWSYGIPWPDVFTRVSHYTEWIQKNVDNLLRTAP